MDTSLKKHGFRYCLVCKSRLKKRGKTAAGRQRWYCRVCTQSSVRKRTDLRHLFTFEQFIEWLLGKASQAELGVASRTFRHQISWCWDVPVPIVQTGEIHHAVIIDGIRVGGRTCLVARTTEYVIDLVWGTIREQRVLESALAADTTTNVRCMRWSTRYAQGIISLVAKHNSAALSVPCMA